MLNLGANNPAASAPSSLQSAQLQIKQEGLTDTSDQLARRVDMNSHALTYPLPYFCQQETQIQINQTGGQTASLTGFRAGEVKQIVVWFTPTTLGGAGNAQTPGNGNYQPLSWSPLTDVQLLYNGEVFNRFDNNSSQLWNLVECEKPSFVNGYTNYTAIGSAPTTGTVLTPVYLKCDFAQVSVPSERDSVLVHGKPVMNAVVSLSFNTSVVGILHAMYIYNASLLMSRGSSEYIF